MTTKKKQNILEWLQTIPVSFLRGDSMPKVFFLLLSVIFWFLIKLSKEGYVTEIRYPVVYQEIPSDKRLISDPPDFITLSIRGGGFDILGHKVRSLQPVEISVAGLEISDTNQYRWNTSDEREVLSDEFDDDVEILDIQPEAIFFNFSEIQSKKVKVYLDSERKYSRFKTLYRPPMLTPDSITIWGTPEQLTAIDSAYTKRLKLTAEEDSITHVVPLDLPQEEGLEYSNREVRVNIIYTSLTEGSAEIPVEVVNPPEDYEITLVPENVTVTYRVPIRDFSKIQPADFKAFVDYGTAGENARFLNVQLSSIPTFVRKTSVNPKQVEFILTAE